jgi:hypothetical protein
MHCKDLEAVLEQEGLAPLPTEAREHLAACSACQGFLADLNSIVGAARQFPSEIAPPDRIWLSLRAQLAAEGVIKENLELSEKPGWLQNVAALFAPRTLATFGVAVALLLASFLVVRKPVSPRARITPQVSQPAAQVSSATPPAPAPAPQPAPTAPIAPSVSPAPARNAPVQKALLPSPSESASGVLNAAERDVSPLQLAGNSQVDASLRENLRTVDEFIAECEQHLKQFPQDQLAREYLYAAYQQKAELLSAMMESGRSEH